MKFGRIRTNLVGGVECPSHPGEDRLITIPDYKTFCLPPLLGMWFRNAAWDEINSEGDVTGPADRREDEDDDVAS
jgi:hypothetical protein